MPTAHIPVIKKRTGVAAPEPPAAVPNAAQRIVIDPLTRIEGHLRIETKIEDGRVTDAWSAGTMFRGLEIILQGRDPRDAWLFAQRICGVCTTVHAIASVRAVENALGLQVPDNARLLRNLIEGAQFVQDHVVHFYHLHALDWVDMVSALSADPTATARLALSISDWPNASPEYFTQVRDKLATFINSGQLGLFANAYWGHPAYRLPPEGNLLAVAHYLEALEWQRDIMRMHALLGGKNPHPQTYAVGGMAVPVGPNGTAGITPARIAEMRAMVNRALDFVNKVYVPDLMLIGSFYTDWLNTGRGYGNMLSYGDFPTNTSDNPAALWMPRGTILNAQGAPLPVETFDHNRVQEYVTHSWYNYSGGNGVGLHPYQGQTQPNYTGPQPPYESLTTDKYSWLKAPRYDGQPMEVGPLARVLVAVGSGHTRIQTLVSQVMGALSVELGGMVSTLGRMAARAIETVAIAEQMQRWLNDLENNINRNDLTVHNGSRWDPSTWPAAAEGWGTTEAPRGGLGHWVRIENGRIASYQAVVPTTWNGSPRDAQGRRGVWEEALIGTPVADPTRPLEILRTIHSFDPCMACAVHLVDADNRELSRIDLSTF
jgi:Ni,Fe-hydrogenase I large subunit